MGRLPSAWVCVAVLVVLTTSALLAMGCGVDTSVHIPTFPSMPTRSSDDGPGDTASFQVGSGGSITITQSGRATVHNGGMTELDHDGPLGCKGRYFIGDYTEHIRLFFRYTAHDAWMLIGTGHLFHFGKPPARKHGALVWSRHFDGQPVRVTVNCPLPRSHHHRSTR
jgi:hypothetical protein